MEDRGWRMDGRGQKASRSEDRELKIEDGERAETGREKLLVMGLSVISH
jgi:hypothetical protein